MSTETKAQVYFYQDRTRRRDDGYLPRKIGAQLVLEDVLLAEAGFMGNGYGVPNLSGSAYEIGRFIRDQMKRRNIQKHELLTYQKFQGTCFSKGELPEREDTVLHLEVQFLMGLNGDEAFFSVI
jgi:hypothetical protein